MKNNFYIPEYAMGLRNLQDSSAKYKPDTEQDVDPDVIEDLFQNDFEELFDKLFGSIPESNVWYDE